MTRDVLIGAVPPVPIASWYSLALIVVAGLLAFGFSRLFQRPCCTALAVGGVSRTRYEGRPTSTAWMPLCRSKPTPIDNTTFRSNGIG
jgi:hypothetical protein